jgi:hypothetical protein
LAKELQKSCNRAATEMQYLQKGKRIMNEEEETV